MVSAAPNSAACRTTRIPLPPPPADALTLPITDPKAAAAAAAEIGYPVLVKASAGGGGKGMRVVRQAAELGAALTTAASEALKAFGDASV